MLIVDDHAEFRAAARALLEAEGFEVVGEAGHGLEAVTRADQLRPDVVLLDIQLPDLSGFEVARRLASVAQPPQVVLISSRDATTYGSQLSMRHARGFLAKGDLSGAAVTALLD